MLQYVLPLGSLSCTYVIYEIRAQAVFCNMFVWWWVGMLWSLNRPDCVTFPTMNGRLFTWLSSVCVSAKKQNLLRVLGQFSFECSCNQISRIVWQEMLNGYLLMSYFFVLFKIIYIPGVKSFKLQLVPYLTRRHKLFNVILTILNKHH